MEKKSIRGVNVVVHFTKKDLKFAKIKWSCWMSFVFKVFIFSSSNGEVKEKKREREMCELQRQMYREEDGERKEALLLFLFFFNSKFPNHFFLKSIY